MPLPTLDIRREEAAAVGWSFLYFFALLCAYYILRPVREAMGVQAGVQNLPWLFTATFVVMLLAVPVFGALTARWPRRVVLPAVYLFFIANLVGFWLAFRVDAWMTVAAPVFFVWLSVFNLYAVSVFWSFMVDLYSEPQSRRLFGYIAAGGTVGALTGPTVTATLVSATGPAPLLLVSALLLGVCVLCIAKLGRWARLTSRDTARAAGAALGGGVWDGAKAVVRSRYLLGICGYLFAYTVLSTLLYVETARLVGDAYPTVAERTQLFAMLDLAVNGLTLLLQVFLTSRIIRGLGITTTLALLPAFVVIGFAVIGFFPVLAVVLIFGVVRRAGEFALSKPAREILFTIVPRDEKYKAKNFIDTVVYRGGDAMSSWIGTGLRTLGGGLATIAAFAVPLSFAWLALAVWLGRRQEAVKE